MTNTSAPEPKLPFWARVNVWPQFIIQDTNNQYDVNLLMLDETTGRYTRVGELKRDSIDAVMGGFYEGNKLGAS